MASGTAGFRGERLTQAREARGLSGISLAEITGVSPASISQYERNIQKPPLDTIEKLGLSLNVRLAFFMRPITARTAPLLLYRCMSAATKASRTRAERRYEWLQEIVQCMEAYFDLPALNLPSFPIPADFRKITRQLIEDVASACREYWHLGSSPLPHTVRLLEKNGVIVSRGNLDADTLDAFSEYASSTQAFIFLGADKNVCVRSRFDAMHELGHLILHRGVGRRNINLKADFKILEQQAHHFASAIQLPAQGFSHEVWVPSLDTFVALKERWKVSIGTMIKRCQELKMITLDESKRLFINRTRREWQKREPFDNTLAVEQPELLKQCFERLIGAGVKAKDDLLDDLGLSSSDVQDLAGLPQDFFKENTSDIIPMPRFRGEELAPPNQPGKLIPFRPA